MNTLAKQIIKSRNDKRIYKHITLKNQLECLLISDNETEKSAASMSVGVGKLEDPKEFEGLAHFLEHMLFLGTEKYPEVSSYKQYLSANSGTSNAYTSMMETNFHFACSNQGFSGALDRFAQFFIAPLFSEEMTQKEMNAVNSEFQKNLRQEIWRQSQLLRHLSLKGNKYNQFGTGNLETLNKPGLRENLLKFYSNYYSSNIMKLVVLGQEDVNFLEEQVVQVFSSIPNKNIARPAYTNIPFDSTNLGKLVKTAPINDRSSLNVRFLIKNLRPHYKSCPAKYITHLLGHEGPNSLLSILKAEGLALELMSGRDNEMNLFSFITVKIMLTDKGLQEYEQVLEYLFYYIKMMKDKEPQEWVFKEEQQIFKLKFESLEKVSPYSYVSELSSSLLEYPVEHALVKRYLLEEFNPDLINQFLNDLKIENSLFLLVSKKFEGKLDQIEPIYGTEYSVEELSQSLRQRLANPQFNASKTKKIIDLPPKNKFIPKNTNIYDFEDPLNQEACTKILSSNTSEVWYKRDQSFLTPKAMINIKLYCKDCSVPYTPLSYNLSKLWVIMLKNYLREISYMANLATIDSSVTCGVMGIEVSFKGFNDSLGNIAEEFLTQMIKFRTDIEQDLFEDCFDQMRKEFANYANSPPSTIARDLLNQLLTEGSGFEIHMLAEALKELKFSDFQSFCREFGQKVFAVWFFTGNLQKNECLELVKRGETILSSATSYLDKESIHQIRPVCLNKGNAEYLKKKLEDELQNNSAIIVHFQSDRRSLDNEVMIEFLVNHLKAPIFGRLRTNEQLGYIVSTSILDKRGVIGVDITVQSNVAGPQKLSERIEKMLQDFRSNIINMTAEAFETQRNSMITNYKEKDYNIFQGGTRVWNEIIRFRYLFDKKQKKIEIAENLKKVDIEECFEMLFFKDSRRIEVHVVSPAHSETDDAAESEKLNSHLNRKISSITNFKRSHSLYPDFYGFSHM